ncbi:protein translocase subunit SecD [bacterium]|nr:protein translocase subunit SecD [bacterium]
MSKKKSIILLSVVGVLIVALALIIVPLNGQDSFRVGDSNYDFYWVSTAISKGLDLQGGMYAEYSAKLQNGSEVTSSDMDGAIANLEEILFGKGYTEATVTKQGTDQIRVEVPNIEDTNELMKLIGKSATLEFRDESGKVLITGNEHLKDCYAATYEGAYVIKLEFNALGKTAFATATSENVGKTIAIYIDDVEIMKPTVNAAITDGSAIIEGNYTYDSANDYAVRIKAGVSNVKLTLLRSETISPTLGDEALSRSILAAGIGILIIFAFMILVYKGLGVCASLALITYVELLVLFLAIVPWVQLTLTGIAGVILSIGMAVDANVIIFERIKEEKFIGNKLMPSAVNAGFKGAFVTIIDANITTIFGSIVMMIFGSSAIKSFALTLLIGIVLSLFTSIFITRFFINSFMAIDDEKESFYGLATKTKGVANV